MSDLANHESPPESARPGRPEESPPDPAGASKRRLSVVLKLTLLVGLTLALLLGVLLTASWFYWRRVLREEVDERLTAVAASRAHMVRTQISLLQQRVALNTDRGEFRGFFYETANHQPSTKNRESSLLSLQRMADGQPILTAALADAEGNVLLSTNPSHIGRNVAKMPEFKAGLAEPYVGAPRPVRDHFESILAAPVRTQRSPERVYGVLLASADVSALAQPLRDVTGLGKTGEALLGVRDGDQLQFLFPPRNAPQTMFVPAQNAPALKASTEGINAFFRMTDYRGVPVLAAGRPVGYAGWALVVKMDASEAYLPIRRAQHLGIIVGVLVAIAGLGAAYALASSFTRPVRRLAQAAARVTSGDYESSVPVESSDEFGSLSANFNEMTASIRAHGAERDRAEEALREADRRKDEFLAMLSHELRNPLSAITHSLRMEEDGADDPENAALAHGVISRQTNNLVHLVDDLLDVTRITAGKIELRKSQVEVSEAIRRASESVRPAIEERRHHLELSLADDERLHVQADPLRLEQIITNLLTNAAKYTPDGGRINVLARCEDQDVVITVSDTGIGIASGMLPKIFELFTQADRKTGGLGIGLSLCRQLVGLHGGTIAAHSAGIGKGTTFTVHLPAVAAPERTAPPPAPIATVPRPVRATFSSPHRRILLVDDNVDTIRSLGRLMTMRGHEVATAYDGLAALKVAQEFQPDFFVLDIGLPGIDGYELARRLRAGGFPDTPMVAASGYAQPADRARAKEAGFDLHFTKPIDLDALSRLLVTGLPEQPAA